MADLEGAGGPSPPPLFAQNSSSNVGTIQILRPKIRGVLHFRWTPPPPPLLGSAPPFSKYLDPPLVSRAKLNDNELFTYTSQVLVQGFV